MYGALDISTSGMVAQRTRLAAIAANIANSNTILNERGELDPFKRRHVHFAPGDPTAPSRSGRNLGVHVREIEADTDAIKMRYMPGSPYADDRGYVPTPDINSTVEQINAIQATRSYEANVTAAETTKTMMAQALRLLA
ncbi:MAG: flagellar basal body rod protein FlgC [Planctomycetota bacterium]